MLHAISNIVAITILVGILAYLIIPAVRTARKTVQQPLNIIDDLPSVEEQARHNHQLSPVE